MRVQHYWKTTPCTAQTLSFATCCKQTHRPSGTSAKTRCLYLMTGDAHHAIRSATRAENARGGAMFTNPRRPTSLLKGRLLLISTAVLIFFILVGIL